MDENFQALDRHIKDLQRKAEIERRKKQKDRERKAKKEKEFLEKENKLLPEKIRLCKEIFTWARGFIKTEQFRDALEVGGYSRELYVHGGGWGHRVPEFGGSGCWSRVYLTSKNGPRLLYCPGYKWMPGMEDLTFTKPEAMAEKLYYQYLKDFHESVKSGNVYKTIRKWLRCY